MNPHKIFCPNIECPARGQSGKGNIRVHSQKEKRYICDECGETFAATRGTIFYRLRTDPKTVLLAVALLAYGCPIQAIVRAFGFDERTVRDWWQRAGQHCQKVHEHKVEKAQLDLQQVQADEIKVKKTEGHFWMALAIMVSTRLWLGGVVSPHRDLDLIQSLSDKIKNIALCRPLLLAVDGLSSYVSAFRNSFRTAVPHWGHETGRPRLVSWPNIAIVQVIKHRQEDQLNITRRIVQGGEAMVNNLIRKTQGQGIINTAFIERLNATFRQRFNNLARRTRTLVHKAQTLEAGMYVIGCFYNFCDPHHSLRLKLSVGRYGYRWVQRTPAIVAGLADHIWSPAELLDFKVPPPRWQPPVKRGPRSLATQKLVEKWCS
jgi:transposase-like protein